MTAWITIIGSSAVVGFLLSYIFKKRKVVGVLTAPIIPLLGLLVFLLHQEYCEPYTGGGASLWPVAWIFGGTVGGATSILVFIYNRERLIRQK